MPTSGKAAAFAESAAMALAVPTAAAQRAHMNDELLRFNEIPYPGPGSWVKPSPLSSVAERVHRSQACGLERGPDGGEQAGGDREGAGERELLRAQQHR